ESLSVGEQKYFDSWIKESDENKKLFLRLQSLHKDKNGLSKINDIDIDSAWTNVLRAAKTERTVPTLLQITKYAAIFIGIFTLGYLYWQTNHSIAPIPVNEDAITLQLENGEIQQISNCRVIASSLTGIGAME